MKRFLLFGGTHCYYARGGWHDMIGSFASIDEATAMAKVYKVREEWMDDDDFKDARVVMWWHVVDVETMSMVAGTSAQPYGAPDRPIH